ncbi:hypothetical protein M758_3G163800 [Ceratodon purpureus]|nr:hypothetical protein M758_3G163800 [Ceratodon purpureus]
MVTARSDLTIKSRAMATYFHLVFACLLLEVQIILRSFVFAQAQNTNFTFPYFNTTDGFLMINDTRHDADNSSFLMNSIGTANAIASCGRLLYSEKVRMKDPTSGEVASFQTTFTFQMTGENSSYSDQGFLPGEGMAFTFARNTTIVGLDGGASLCLLKEVDNGQASNRLFAVEFDSYFNPSYNDSSDSHIGVNVNSMNSTWYYNLCGFWGQVNCSSLCNGGYYTAWIDYNSTLEMLEVYLVTGISFDEKPAMPQIVAQPLSLSDILDDYMYIGFSASSGSGLGEVHEIRSWKFTNSMCLVENVAVHSSKRRKDAIIVGVSVGAVGAFLFLGVVFVSYRRRASYRNQDKVNFVDPNHMLPMFSYKVLSKATKNFSKSEFLGSGGFGAVYKGTLPSGAQVAVKRLRMESRHGEESFQAEVVSLSHIRHRNLVKLRGWCHEEDQLLLVYDFMSHGSLNEWLFHFSKHIGEGSLNLKGCKALPLVLRHSILSGVAAALAYLHEECPQCVLHRDIKSSNVLLDGDWNAYLGDFGLARVVDHQKMEKTTMMAGTFGYMAPEMPHTGKATKESDVYSFGVLMLEVMCGKRALEMGAIEQGEGVLVDRVWRAHEAGNILEVADSRLEAIFPHPHTHKNPPYSVDDFTPEASLILASTEDTTPAVDPALTSAPDIAALDEKKLLIKNLLHLGLLCCNPNPEDRPSMRTVSQLLPQLLQSPEDMEMSLPPLSDFRPHAYYSQRSVLSEGVVTIPWSSWSSSNGPSVRDSAQGLSQSMSTPPFSSASSRERANSMLASSAAPYASTWS